MQNNDEAVADARDGVGLAILAKGWDAAGGLSQCRRRPFRIEDAEDGAVLALSMLVETNPGTLVAVGFLRAKGEGDALEDATRRFRAWVAGLRGRLDRGEEPLRGAILELTAWTRGLDVA